MKPEDVNMEVDQRSSSNQVPKDEPLKAKEVLNMLSPGSGVNN